MPDGMVQDWSPYQPRLEGLRSAYAAPERGRVGRSIRCGIQPVAGGATDGGRCYRQHGPHSHAQRGPMARAPAESTAGLSTRAWRRTRRTTILVSSVMFASRPAIPRPSAGRQVVSGIPTTTTQWGQDCERKAPAAAEAQNGERPGGATTHTPAKAATTSCNHHGSCTNQTGHRNATPGDTTR